MHALFDYESSQLVSYCSLLEVVSEIHCILYILICAMDCEGRCSGNLSLLVQFIIIDFVKPI